MKWKEKNYKGWEKRGKKEGIEERKIKRGNKRAQEHGDDGS